MDVQAVLAPKRFCSKCKHKGNFFVTEVHTVCDECVAERSWTEKDPRKFEYAPKWEADNGK